MSDSDDAFQSADEGDKDSDVSSLKAVEGLSNEAEPFEVAQSTSESTDKSETAKKDENIGRAGKPKSRRQMKKNKKKQAVQNSRDTTQESEDSSVQGGEDKSGSSRDFPDRHMSDDLHQTTEGLFLPLDEKSKSSKETGLDVVCDASDDSSSPNNQFDETKFQDNEAPVSVESGVSKETNKDSEESNSKSLTSQPAEDYFAEKTDSSETNETKELKREPTPTRKMERQPKEEDGAEDHQQILDRLSGAAEKPKESGGWGWGGWGSSWGSSLLSTATSSVATFTTQVGEGMKTVMETVESTIGAPDPAELARQARASKVKEPLEGANGHSTQSEEEPDEEDLAFVGGIVQQPVSSLNKKTADEEHHNQEKSGDESKLAAVDEEDDSSWFASWGVGGIAGISKVVEKTGKTLVTGSLDVLETIGKKTFEVVAEGDHGLKKQLRNTGNKPNLSFILREAAKDAEEMSKLEEEYNEARQAHFGSLFDEYNGLAHLEALELLANQSEGRVHTLLSSLPPSKVQDIKPDLISMKEIFQVDDTDEESEEEAEQDFGQLMTEYYGSLGVNISPEQIIEVEDKTRQWLKECQEDQDCGDAKAPKELHKRSIQALAELTACSIQHFHKVGQLLQMEPQGPMVVFTEKATHLASILKVLGVEVDIISSRFTACLNTAADDSEDPDAVTPLITNVYLEATNSKTYLQDAFQLLLPVLQSAAILATTKS